MRISQVVLHDGIGGMETLAHGLHSELRQLGHTATIHILDPGLAAGRPAGRVVRLRSLRAALRDFSPDVIISHSALPNIYARAAARRVPVITVLHSAEDDFINLELRLSEMILTRRTAKVVAVSTLNRQRYLYHFPRMTQSTVVIPNGISGDIVMRRDGAAEPIRMVALSRLVPVKRVDLLLTALRQLLRDTTLPSLSLDIIGAGCAKYVRQLEEQILADDPLKDCVRLLGRRDDVNNLLSQYDLFVHPSKWEGHSLAILEAAAAGLPAIVSDTVAGGVDSQVVKFTFSTDNAASLARSMRSAILSLEAVQRQAAYVAPSIREKYSLRRCALRYLRLCEAVIVRKERGT